VAIITNARSGARRTTAVPVLTITELNDGESDVWAAAGATVTATRSRHAGSCGRMTKILIAFTTSITIRLRGTIL
jgi:hypothetical protein